MAKYSSWADFERNAPIAYREGATPDRYRSGLSRIAPPGTAPKEDLVRSYGQGVADKADLFVDRYRRRMFE